MAEVEPRADTTADRSTPTRPVLAGNSLAGGYVLDLLLEGWAPADLLVIAPPGGPRHGWQPSLADHARRRGVAVLDPLDVNDGTVVDAVRAHGADLLLSVYYTQLFRAPLLDAVDGPALNFHPSLLPRHRGTAPLIWAIADGDAVTGVSVHELTLGVDTGPLLWQRRLPIHPDDTGYTLHLKAAGLVRSIAADLLRALRAGRPLPDPVEQAGTPTVHTSRDPQLNQIDWAGRAEHVRNVVRALAAPLPGAYSTWQGRRIGIEEVDVLAPARSSRAPGMVEVGPSGLAVWAADAPVRIELVRLDDEVVPATALIERGLTEGHLFA